MVGLYLHYQHFKHRPGSGMIKRILVKCGATLMAALVCLLGAIDSGLPAHWLMLVGLVVCAAADGSITATAATMTRKTETIRLAVFFIFSVSFQVKLR